MGNHLIKALQTKLSYFFKNKRWWTLYGFGYKVVPTTGNIVNILIYYICPFFPLFRFFLVGFDSLYFILVGWKLVSNLERYYINVNGVSKHLKFNIKCINSLLKEESTAKRS